MSNERDFSTEWKWNTILKFLPSPFWIVSNLLSVRLLHGGPLCDFINIYKKMYLKGLFDVWCEQSKRLCQTTHLSNAAQGYLYRN
jgi:hypothetical protein